MCNMQVISPVVFEICPGNEVCVKTSKYVIVLNRKTVKVHISQKDTTKPRRGDVSIILGQSDKWILSYAPELKCSHIRPNIIKSLPRPTILKSDKNILTCPLSTWK